MRIAVISDTHMPKGGRVLPETCCARLRAADLILHAGDVTGEAFLEELVSIGPGVAAVHGNMDVPSLQAALPAARIVEAAGLRIGMLHEPGPRSGREERLAARFAGCAAVVFGHTHLPEVVRHGGVWILNPGSPTERRRAPARTMLELVIAGGELVPELVTVGT
jgi:putative phosphoesterase